MRFHVLRLFVKCVLLGFVSVVAKQRAILICILPFMIKFSLESLRRDTDGNYAAVSENTKCLNFENKYTPMLDLFTEENMRFSGKL